MIAIKGLKMPKNCRECPCYSFFWTSCDAIRRIDYEANDAVVGDQKPEQCPLVELEVGEVAFVFDGEKLRPTLEGKHDEH